MHKIIWPGSAQLAPVPPALVATGGNGFANNVLTVAWTGIVCSDPPMLSIGVRPERFSWKALRETGEFTLNLPSVALAETTDWCGVNSGRDHDKFAERGLTALPGSRVAAPIVGECPLSLECRTKQVLELGAHHLFLAEILAVQVSEECMNPDGSLNLEKADLLAYAHGNYYSLGRSLGRFGFSVRRRRGSHARA